MADYIEQCRRLMGARRCVECAFTPADERLAASLFERTVPIEHVEHAVVLGCARKYVTLINRQSGDSIMSFSYFENVIEEVRELKMSPDYWRHLQMRVDRPGTAVGAYEGSSGPESRAFVTERAVTTAAG